jgi:hypothetical protein
MERDLTNKTILIVQGALLAGPELKDVLSRSGARVYLTTSEINAFNLLRRIHFDGVLLDQGLHNVAFDLCSVLHELGVPYIFCNAPHRLQKPAALSRDAKHAARRLDNIISSQPTLRIEHLKKKQSTTEGRTAMG